MTDRLEERMRLAAHGNGGPGIQDDVLDEVERALSKVAGAISAAFNAGMEERENGSARRQGVLIDVYEACKAETAAAIARLREARGK